MRILYSLVIFSVIFSVGLLATIYAEGENSDVIFNLSDIKKQYVFSSDNYFLVYGIDNNQLIPIDGGVLYNSEWQIFNMTDVKLRQFDNGNAGWIEEGKLENSNNRFWFNWDLAINGTGHVTGVWIYDGKVLTEFTDYNTYKDRLLL